jgi:hypothetical protein
VALGVARVQARRRRVALADVVGEEPALQELVPSDLPYGLVDSFFYGVSLNRIAFPVDPAENLFILPSGAPPVDSDEILGSDRWRRLAAGFREIGALLLVVAPARAARLDALLTAMDGVVVVGDAHVAVGAPVLARVVAPAVEPAEIPGWPEVADTPAEAARTDGAPARPITPVRPAPRWPTAALPQQWVVPAAAVLALAAAVLVLVWRGGSRRQAAPVAARTDSAAAEAPAPTESAAGTLSSPAVDSIADAADTARFAPFVVVVANLNDSASAIAKATGLVRRVPVPTVSRADTQGTTWFRVTAGAFPSATSADSLLQALRRRGVIGRADGYVQRAPYSIKITPRPVSPLVAHALADRLRASGWPVFGLVQPGRVTNLYIGAFETPRQAASQMASLRADSVTLSVAYRIGSVF